MKLRILLMLVLLLGIFFTGCSSDKAQIEQLTKKNAKLTEDVEYLKQSNKNLSLEIEGYRQKVVKLQENIDYITPEENEVTIPKELDLEILKVLLTYFEGVKGNDEGKVRSTIRKGIGNVDNLVAWGKDKGLMEVNNFRQDDVGRPQYTYLLQIKVLRA